MHTPTVDIVIAAKNEATHIGACIEALKQQDYPAEKLRIYVVDNGSTDTTTHIAEQHGVVVLREGKRGAAAARNCGLAYSAGELVGFLDGHCLPERSWVRLMAEQFQDAALGGCQGRIDNRSTNGRVQTYLQQSGALSNQRILEDTVNGKRNIYPWLLSGNCMYRREALQGIGFFDDRLESCEDVDLAWRVLLLGYQLGYVPEATLTHYDCNTWHAFVRKGLVYGKGAATLAHTYRDHGARNKFEPRQFLSASPERLLGGLYYWIGYRLQDARIRLGRDPVSLHTLQPVLGRFRPKIPWTPRETLQISDVAVFWLRNDEQTSVIVHIPTKTRVVLDSVGDFIWRRIVDRSAKDDLARAIAAHYAVSAITAIADLDEFVEELRHAGLIIVEQI